jgi:hypothetical protein
MLVVLRAAYEGSTTQTSSDPVLPQRRGRFLFQAQARPVAVLTFRNLDF